MTYTRHHATTAMYLFGAVLFVLVIGIGCGGTDEEEVTSTPTATSPATKATGFPTSEPDVAATQLPIPQTATLVSPQPTATTAVASGTRRMKDPRGGWHTATLLQDGRVLVVGGFIVQPDSPQTNVEHLDTVEIYDPAIGTWTPADSMALPRAEHTTTLLDDGTVLIVGGIGRGFGVDPDPYAGFRSTAKIYDPSTDSWVSAGKMEGKRAQHATIRLADGRVLIAGGSGIGPSREYWGNWGGETESAEVYDPSTGTWSQTGSMSKDRDFPTLTLLEDGRVLATGGFGAAMAEVYYPSDGTWTETGAMHEERRWHTATLLDDGRVLVVGGLYSSEGREYQALRSAEIWNPASGVWTQVEDMSEERGQHTATRLPDGRVLVVGGTPEGYLFGGGGVFGVGIASVEIFDPSSGSWSPVKSMSQNRTDHAAVLLDDGRVLVVGGTGDAALVLDSSELFDPSTETWSSR